MPARRRVPSTISRRLSAASAGRQIIRLIGWARYDSPRRRNSSSVPRSVRRWPWVCLSSFALTFSNSRTGVPFLICELFPGLPGGAAAELHQQLEAEEGDVADGDGGGRGHR